MVDSLMWCTPDEAIEQPYLHMTFALLIILLYSYYYTNLHKYINKYITFNITHLG